MGFSDKEIIELIKRGDSRDVLLSLYKEVRPKVKNWIILNSGNEEEAQDVFQDAVLIFYKYVTQGKFKVGNSVPGFIFTICRNLWINRAKQLSRTQVKIEEHENVLTDGLDASEVKLSKERAELIQEILSQLGGRCKELLTYSIFYKMKMDEISDKMGFSNADTAKTKNYKCKQRLIQLMKEKPHLKQQLYK